MSAINPLEAVWNQSKINLFSISSSIMDWPVEWSWAFVSVTSLLVIRWWHSSMGISSPWLLYSPVRALKGWLTSRINCCHISPVLPNRKFTILENQAWSQKGFWQSNFYRNSIFKNLFVWMWCDCLIIKSANLIRRLSESRGYFFVPNFLYIVH